MLFMGRSGSREEYECTLGSGERLDRLAQAWQEKGPNAGDREGWKEARGRIYGRGRKAYPVNPAGHFISLFQPAHLHAVCGECCS